MTSEPRASDARRGGDSREGPPHGELSRLSRATIVSLVATGLETFVVLPLFVRVMPDWVAFAAVQIFANAITFLLYKYWAFAAAKVGTLHGQYARQSLVFVGSWALNTGIPSLFTHRLHWGPVLSFALSNVIVYLAWNYPLNRLWVFVDRGPRPTAG